MKLMKILFSSFATVLMLVSSMSFVYASETTDTVIKSFAEGIDSENWSEVTQLYSNFEKDDVEVFFNNQNNLVEKVGFYSIEQFELVDYLKINSDDLTKFATIGKYSDIYGTDQFLGYRIAVDVKCELESKYFYNGLNYFLIILVNEDNNWKIAEFSSASPELINYEGNTSKVSAKTIKNYEEEENLSLQIAEERNKGLVLNGNGEVIETNQATSEDILIEKGYSLDEIAKMPKAVTNTTRPDTIRVYRNATGKIETINYYEYLKNVLPNEWIGSWAQESLKAGAQASKMYSWYRVYNPKYPGMGYDTKDTTADQKYVPNSAQTTCTSAINAVGGVGYYTSKGNFFETQYRAGTSGSYGTKSGGVVYQWGTKKLADEGYGYLYILQYYLNGVSYNDGSTTIKEFTY